MMSDASAKYLRAIEVYDVASARIVGASQMLAKLFFAETAQDRNFPAGVGPGGASANSSSVRPRMHMPVQHRPVPANTFPSVPAA